MGCGYCGTSSVSLMMRFVAEAVVFCTRPRETDVLAPRMIESLIVTLAALTVTNPCTSTFDSTVPACVIVMSPFTRRSAVPAGTPVLLASGWLGFGAGLGLGLGLGLGFGSGIGWRGGISMMSVMLGT